MEKTRLSDDVTIKPLNKNKGKMIDIMGKSSVLKISYGLLKGHYINKKVIVNTLDAGTIN